MSSTAYAQPAQIDNGSVLDGSKGPVVVASGSVPVLIAVEGSSERQERVSLGTVFDLRFRVLRPIPVALDRSAEGVSAVWPEIDEFGHADSASAAAVELARGVVELYETLNREQKQLGPDLERVWAVLRDYIERVR